MTAAGGLGYRRVLGLVLLVVAISGTAWLHFQATNFPTADPIPVVDQELVDRLRNEPGLHLALATDYQMQVSLDLQDDEMNRRVYGTSVDLRERVPRQAIHIQQKGERAAIHTDDHNPKAGVVPWLLHATLDVPFMPLPLLALVGLWLLLRPGRSRP